MAQDQSCGTDGSADGGADHASQQNELENILRSLKCVTACGETGNEIAADDGLERVTGSETNRSKNCAGRSEIDEEGSNKNRGPHAVAENQ